MKLRWTVPTAWRTACTFESGRPAKSNEKPPRMPPLWPIAAGTVGAREVIRVSPGASTVPMAKGRPSSESVSNFYSAAGGAVAHDGRHRSGRHGRIFSIASFGLASGRLSDHPNPDLLSGRKSGSDDFGGYRTAGEAVWTGAWADADDLHQLLRQFADYSAIFARSQHRRSRAGSAGGHQPGWNVSSDTAAESPHLQ